ncbi:MAG TPA: TetR/AcrR family transcriptional regulator [Acidimicrobiales bacterium]|jgi:AcrR family transcriptional regulator|nr:TetR/AcrR family transcriptional regulator [Acidimicrobiales bacterium]
MVEEPARSVGRPRSAEIDRNVKEAALDLLVERGYAGVSMEGVAARAGVGKAAIYRRWATKAELVVDSLGEHVCAAFPFVDTGDLRADLLSMLTNVQKSMAGDDGPIMAAFVAEKSRYPELRAEFERVFISQRRAHLQRLIVAAVERGDLPPETDVELLAEAGPALLSHHYLFHSRDLDPAMPARIVDLLVPARAHSATRSSKRAARRESGTATRRA